MAFSDAGRAVRRVVSTRTCVNGVEAGLARVGKNLEIDEDREMLPGFFCHKTESGASLAGLHIQRVAGTFGDLRGQTGKHQQD